MIRDTRQINIETNFFDDDADDQLKMQEETFESTLHSREKGVIALFNILDTIRLHRIINSFNRINAVPRVRIRRYSSKLMVLRDLSLHKKSSTSQYGEKQKELKENSIEEELESSEVEPKYQSKLVAKKRCKTVNSAFAKESYFLRQQRKHILRGITKQLQDKSLSRNYPHSIDKNTHSHHRFTPHLQPREDNLNGKRSNQTSQINLRLQKLEHLIKNIRREKEQQEPIRIHQKKSVRQLPKPLKNQQQMKLFLQEISSIRKEVEEVKLINESILLRSRERSARTSRMVKSERGDRDTPHDIATRAKITKKSEVIMQRKDTTHWMTNNKSEKLCGLKSVEHQETWKGYPISKAALLDPAQKKDYQLMQPKQPKRTEPLTQPQQIKYVKQTQQTIQVQQTKQAQQVEKTQPIQQPQPPKPQQVQQTQQAQPKTKPKVEVTEAPENTELAEERKYSPISKITKFVSKELGASSKQRLKREPSITESDEQLNPNQDPQTKKNGWESKEGGMAKWKVEPVAVKTNIQGYPSVSDLPGPSSQLGTTNSANKQKEPSLNMVRVANQQETSPLPNNFKEHREKAWYKKYGEPVFSFEKANKKTVASNANNAKQPASHRRGEDPSPNHETSTCNGNQHHTKVGEENGRMYKSSNDSPFTYDYYNNTNSDAESISQSSDQPNRQANNNTTDQTNYNYAALYSNLTNSQNDTKQCDNKINKYSNEPKELSANQPGLRSKRREQDSGYTDPAFLKELNTVPYRKSCSQALDFKPNIIQQVSSDEGNNKKSYRPSSSGYYNYNINLANSREDNKYESSNNTISDNELGSFNSYTYSKGSSALASINKMDNSAHNTHDAFGQENLEKMFPYLTTKEEPAEGYTLSAKVRTQGSQGANNQKQPLMLGDGGNAQSIHQYYHTTFMSKNKGIDNQMPFVHPLVAGAGNSEQKGFQNI